MTTRTDGEPIRHDDTPIVATSTASGTGARTVIRSSGRGVVAGLADRIRGEAACLPAEGRRGCGRGTWCLSEGLELPVIVFVAIAPASFTGEDVVEIEVPGNPDLARLVADEVREHLETGLGAARFAGPGEFSARAFLNGRISIAEATSIAAGIAADRDIDLESVERMRRTQGGRTLASLSHRLLAVVARLEAAIDFTDEEDVIGCTVDELRTALDPIRTELRALVEAAEVVTESASRTPRVTLVGRPNAGKSSLFNALLGMERVVVSPTAGTTRDVIEAEIALKPLDDLIDHAVPVRLMDTAGIGSAEDPATDIDEAATAASRNAIVEADLILACRTAQDPPRGPGEGTPVIDVITKIDLEAPAMPDPGSVATSSLTGVGLEELRSRVMAWASQRHHGSDAVVGWRTLAETALGRTEEALDLLEDQSRYRAPLHPETTAAACRSAAEAVGRMEGEFDPDAVLDLVFGRFCIGK